MFSVIFNIPFPQHASAAVFSAAVRPLKVFLTPPPSPLLSLIVPFVAPLAQILDVPSTLTSDSPSPRIQMDIEWLAITKVLHPYLPLQKFHNPSLPSPSQLRPLVDQTITDIRASLDAQPRVDSEGNPRDPLNIEEIQQFWPTAPTEMTGEGGAEAWYTNPQTEAICAFLGIPNLVNPAPLAPVM